MRDREKDRDRERDWADRGRDKIGRGREREKERGGRREKDRRDDSRERYEHERSRERSGRREERRTWRFDSPPSGPPDEEGGMRRSLLLEDASGLKRLGVRGGLDGEGGGGDGGVFDGRLGVGAEESSTTSGLVVGSAVFGSLTASLDAATSKAAREIYVGNLPQGVDVNQLMDFLNSAMTALKATVMPGSAATKAWISTDGHYAFVEFRTMEEASNAMQLNGINCLGCALRIGRPKTYPQELTTLVPAPTVAALDSTYLAQGIAGVQSGVEALAAESAPLPPVMAGVEQSSVGSAVTAHSANPSTTGVTSEADSKTGKLAKSGGFSDPVPLDPAAALAAAQTAANAVAAGVPVAQFINRLRTPERLCILGIPKTLSESKVKELVATFGFVKFFQLLKDSKTRESAGVCLCDFEDYDSQLQATEILQENTSYKVMLAEDAASEGLLDEFLDPYLYETAGSATIYQLLNPQIPTRILMMANMATWEELLDQKVYEEILEDIKLECQAIAPVVSIQLPQPARGFDETEIDQTDVGYAFVEFENKHSAARVRARLTGRKFNGKVVEANYFSEKKFQEGNLKSPTPNYDPVDDPPPLPIMDVAEDDEQNGELQPLNDSGIAQTTHPEMMNGVTT